jgi:hypothetical protein
MEIDSARLIIDVMETYEKSPDGIMAQALMAEANRIKSRKIPTLQELQEIEAEQDFKNKIILLRKCEPDQDIGWMDWSSWNNLNSRVQARFKEIVDPLLYSTGAYFQRSKLLLFEHDIYFDLEPSHCIFELYDADQYQYIVLGLQSVYDTMGINKLRTFQKEVASRLIRGIGKSEGEVRFRIYNKENLAYD